MKLISSLFTYSGLILIITNTVLFLMSYRQNKKSIAYKLFTLYLITSFIISLSALILAKKYIPNLHLSHAYFISQFILLSLFYRSLFKSAQKKYVIITIVLVCSILAVQYMFRPSLFYTFNIFEIFITSLPIVIYAMIHLYNSLNGTNNYLIINAGILVYITSSTLIFILGNYLSSIEGNIQVSRNIYLINKILYVVYLSLILIQWRTSFRQVKSKS